MGFYPKCPSLLSLAFYLIFSSFSSPAWEKVFLPASVENAYHNQCIRCRSTQTMCWVNFCNSIKRKGVAVPGKGACVCGLVEPDGYLQASERPFAGRSTTRTVKNRGEWQRSIYLVSS